MIPVAIGNYVSGIWFHGVAFLPYVIRQAGISALAGSRV